MKRTILIALVALMASPVFACGPSGGGVSNNRGGGGGGHNHRKRTDEERRARQAMRDAQRNYQHDANKELLLESIDMGHGTYSRHSPKEVRRLMENRLGHLLYRYKKGTMTNEEAAEAQYLAKVLSQD